MKDNSLILRMNEDGEQKSKIDSERNVDRYS